MSSFLELEEHLQKLQPGENLESNLKITHNLLLKFLKESDDTVSSSSLVDIYYRFCASLTFLEGELDLGFSSLLSVLQLLLTADESIPLKKLHQIIDFIFLHPRTRELTKLFGNACSSFSDLRYYSLKYLMKCSKPICESEVFLLFFESLDTSSIVENLGNLYMLSAEISPKITDLKTHRGLYTKFVLHMLKYNKGFRELEHKKIINLFDEDRMKFMTRPSLLADYFTEAFKNGGVVGLLSLSGLFYLMRKHNLEYRSFYDKLYSLLSPELFGLCKYRRRFLKLISLFMKSTHISDSAYASILKKISKLSLGAPSHSLRWIIPFLYNSMKTKHRLRKMIHNDTECDDWKDPYLADKGVEESCAENSSLWELDTIGKHHYGPISSTMKIFSERLVRPQYDLNKSLDESAETLSSMLKRELGFKWSKKPPTQLKFASSII